MHRLLRVFDKAKREDTGKLSRSGFTPITLQNVLLPAGITALAIVLTFLFIGTKSIWLDEAISIAMARLEWPTLWSVISHSEAPTGLYYVLLYLWLNLGESELVIRSLSAVFAVLTVPTIFVLGFRLFNKSVGLTAALLLTVSAFFIQYSQEARGYSLALFLVTLSSLLFVEAIHRPSKRLWASYAAISCLAVYAHVFTAFILATHATSLIFIQRQQIPWKGLLITWGFIVIFILPLTYSILAYSSHNLDWVARPDVRDIYYLFTNITSNRGVLALFFIICSIALIYAVRQSFFIRNHTETWQHTLLLSWLLVPVILAFGLSQIKPMFISRYFIICVPPLTLLTAVGIFRMPRRWMWSISLLALLVLSSLNLNSYYSGYEKEDWRNATDYILSTTEKGDAIIFFVPMVGTGFEYYKSKVSGPTQFPYPVLYFNPDDYQKLIPVFNIPSRGSYPEPDEELVNRLVDYNRVWLVFSHDTIGRREAQSQKIKDLLQEAYEIPGESHFYGIRVLLFN